MEARDKGLGGKEERGKAFVFIKNNPGKVPELYI